MNLRPRRVLAALTLSVVAAFGGATVAAAAGVGPAAVSFDFPSGNDCMIPPSPTSPNGGTAGSIDAGPAKPIPGNPFATAPEGKPQPTVYDTYGYGGLHVQRADPGCNPTPSWDDTLVSLANIMLDWTATLVGFATMLYRAVMSSFLGSLFQPIQEGLTGMLGNRIFIPLVGLVLLGTALLLVWQARRAKVGATASSVFKTTLILTIGAYTVFAAIPLGNLVDKGVTTIIGSAANTDVLSGNLEPGEALGGLAHESLLFNTWEQMTFGTGKQNAAAAKEFGPRLFMASTFSRDEQARIDKDPSIAGDLSEQKQDDYKKVLTEIKDKYPQPYDYVAGNHAAEQLSYAFLAFLCAVTALLFVIVALLKMVYSMAVTRIGIGVAPAVATVAVFPRLHKVALNLFGFMWEAAAKAVYFGLALVAFVGFGLGGILSPATTMHPILKFIALGVVTYVAWRLAKKLGLMSDIERLKSLGRRFPDEINEPIDEVEELPSGHRRVRKPRTASELFDGRDDARDYPSTGQGEARVYEMRNVRDIHKGAAGIAKEALHLPSGASASTTASTAGASGMGQAAAKGAASNAAAVGAATVLSGGTATVPMLVAAGAKGAVGGASGSALTKKQNAAKTVEPSAIYHPSTTSTAGPGQAAPRRLVSGKAIHDIYQPTGAAK